MKRSLSTAILQQEQSVSDCECRKRFREADDDEDSVAILLLALSSKQDADPVEKKQRQAFQEHRVVSDDEDDEDRVREKQPIRRKIVARPVPCMFRPLPPPPTLPRVAAGYVFQATR